MITRDDWLRALGAAEVTASTNDGSVTPHELAALLGVSITYAYREGDRLVRIGKAVVVRRGRQTPGGRRTVKAYRLLEP
jgi:hypothetical protein